MLITAFWDKAMYRLVEVEVRTASITRAMMEAVRMSETSV
jgi:hypothetical protein